MSDSSPRMDRRNFIIAGAIATGVAVGVYVGKFSVESPLLANASLCVLVLAALVGRRAESCSKLAQHA